MQKSEGCWWFGTPGKCNVFTILAAVLVPCALLDFLSSVAMMILGSEQSLFPGHSTRRCGSMLVQKVVLQQM
jgi:hypothetical protein